MLLILFYRAVDVSTYKSVLWFSFFFFFYQLRGAEPMKVLLRFFCANVHFETSYFPNLTELSNSAAIFSPRT